MEKFLKDNYKMKPSTSNYFRFEDGDNTIRILSSAIVGFEYFNKDNKPVRSEIEFEEVPEDIKENGKIKEFWAFVVWNYNLGKIQIMELTQKSIMNQIMALINNPKWGDVKSFDITISKKGKSLETEYNTVPNPKTDLEEVVKEKYKNTKINLDALYYGNDPFSK
jgi:hypothetical protein